MSELRAARDHYLARHADFDPGREPAWLAKLRAEAKSAFGEAGLPDTRQEEWRYTPVTALAKR